MHMFLSMQECPYLIKPMKLKRVFENLIVKFINNSKSVPMKLVKIHIDINILIRLMK